MFTLCKNNCNVQIALNNFLWNYIEQFVWNIFFWTAAICYILVFKLQRTGRKPLTKDQKSEYIY